MPCIRQRRVWTNEQGIVAYSRAAVSDLEDMQGQTERWQAEIVARQVVDMEHIVTTCHCPSSQAFHSAAPVHWNVGMLRTTRFVCPDACTQYTVRVLPTKGPENNLSYKQMVYYNHENIFHVGGNKGDEQSSSPSRRLRLSHLACPLCKRSSARRHSDRVQ